MSTATATIRYRKTKQQKWVAYGPASIVLAGHTVTVTKASGETKQELIESVGRPFTADGVQMVYGYIAEHATRHEVSTPRGTRTVRHPANCRCWGCYDENS